MTLWMITPTVPDRRHWRTRQQPTTIHWNRNRLIHWRCILFLCGSNRRGNVIVLCQLCTCPFCWLELCISILCWPSLLGRRILPLTAVKKWDLAKQFAKWIAWWRNQTRVFRHYVSVWCPPTSKQARAAASHMPPAAISASVYTENWLCRVCVNSSAIYIMHGSTHNPLLW